MPGVIANIEFTRERVVGEELVIHTSMEHPRARRPHPSTSLLDSTFTSRFHNEEFQAPKMLHISSFFTLINCTLSVVTMPTSCACISNALEARNSIAFP